MGTTVPLHKTVLMLHWFNCFSPQRSNRRAVGHFFPHQYPSDGLVFLFGFVLFSFVFLVSSHLNSPLNPDLA